MMEHWTVEFRTLNPMFLGNAEGNSSELRPSSLKGMIRFWWRASHPHLPLNQLYEKEAEIFGTAHVDEKKNLGRSKLTIHILPSKKNYNITSNTLPSAEAIDPSFYTNHQKVDIFQYLSFGKYDINSKKFFSYIKEGLIFQVQFRFPSTYKEDILKVLECLHRFGTLGGKSRNGFGSIWIDKLNDKPYDHISLGKNNQPYISKQNFSNITQLPLYTAFSSKSRVFLTNQVYPTWDKAHSQIGNAYRYARLNTDGAKFQYKNRLYLSQPILQAKQQNFTERRAKPFFLKVIQFGKGYKGQILYLPAEFVSQDAIQKNKNLDRNQINQEFLKACNEFLNQLLNQVNFCKLQEVPL